MTQLFQYVTPLIGTKGIFEMQGDFASTEGEILECIANRTIADYVANNEDPLNTIYLANSLTAEDYEADAAINLEIVSLRNDGGYVYKVPCKYIVSYPIQDGIGYHAITLACALPALRVGTDLTTVIDGLKQTILSNLGVESVVSPVQTSLVRAVDGLTDATIEAERGLVTDQNIDVYAQITELNLRIAELVARNTVLENYIISTAP